jgi:hypothetical protein
LLLVYGVIEYILLACCVFGPIHVRVAVFREFRVMAFRCGMPRD